MGSRRDAKAAMAQRDDVEWMMCLTNNLPTVNKANIKLASKETLKRKQNK